MQLETVRGRWRQADAVRDWQRQVEKGRCAVRDRKRQGENGSCSYSRDRKRQGEKGRCCLIQVEAGEDRHVLVQLKTGICK